MDVSGGGGGRVWTPIREGNAPLTLTADSSPDVRAGGLGMTLAAQKRRPAVRKTGADHRWPPLLIPVRPGKVFSEGDSLVW